MPTVITHAIVPLALGWAMGRKSMPTGLLLAGAAVAMLPDADVIAFRLGIDYADQLGHRGATHSLMFAAMIGLLGVWAARLLDVAPWRAALWLAACTASHPLFDAMTNGGLGVAALWPWSEERLFAPWRPILVSPIGLDFFGERGGRVLASEIQCLWLPTFAIAAWLGWQRIVRHSPPPTPTTS